MSNKDVFADLFASSSKKNDVSKLTLAERSKISLDKNGNKKQDSFVGLDFLSSTASNSSVNLINGVTTTSSLNYMQNENNNNSNNNNISLIGESFGTLLPKQKNTNVKLNNMSQQVSDVNKTNNNSTDSSNLKSSRAIEKPSTQDLDALFAVFDNPSPVSCPSAAPPSSFESDLVFSPNMASSVNIPPKKPQRPSASKFQDANAEKLETFDDTNTQIFKDDFEDNEFASYNQNPKINNTSAYGSSSNSKNVRNLFDDLSTSSTLNSNKNSDLVADTATELFNSASILFSKGKQALNKNIEKYQAQKKAERSGNPAWMYYDADEKCLRDNNRNRKANASDWDVDMDFDNEEVIDFDGTVLSNTESRNKQYQPKDYEAAKPPLPPQRKSVSSLETSKNVSNSGKNLSGTGLKPSKLVNLFDDFTITSSQNGLLSTTQNEGFNTTIADNNLTVLDSAALAQFNSFKKSGGDFFKEGNFTEALNYYQKAQLCSVEDSKVQLLAFSNLCTTYMKLGDTSNVILNADRALKLIDDGKIFGMEKGNNGDLEKVIIPETNKKNAKEFFVKIHGKKAEAYELNDKYDLALTEWKIVLENGGATKSSIDGKRRCLEALGKIKKKTTVAPQRTIKKPGPSVTNSTSEAVKRVKENNREQERFEQEKYLLYDTVEQKINSWKHGKEDNIRALLVSLDQVLWPDMNWKPVKLNDLIIDKKVRICYMKAIAKTHPDKMGKNFSTEQKLIAQQIFVTLNKAWDLFKVQNGIN